MASELLFAITFTSQTKAKDRIGAIKWLSDRGFGSVPQPHEISNPEDGRPIIVELKHWPA